MLSVAAFLSASNAYAADIVLKPGDDILTKTAVLAAGDRYLLEDGVYDISSDLYWSGVGTEETPIYIGAASGAKPIFRMSAGYFLVQIHDAAFLDIFGITFEGAEGWEEVGFNGISIQNATDIRFTDNEIRYFDGSGINIGGASSRLTISGNWIHDVQAEGIYAGCNDASCFTTDSLFAGNLIHTLGSYLEDGTPNEYATGVVIAHGGQGNTVRDNVIFGTSNDGIYVGSTEFGNQNIVESNAIWETYEDGIVIEGAAIVRNNLVFNVGDDGIRSYNSDRNTLQDVVISFNTVVGAVDYAVEVSDWIGKPGMVLANNAIVNPIGLALRYEWSDYEGESPDPQNLISTNIVTGYVEGWDVLVHPVGVIPGGGLEDFEDAAAFDFYPKSNSALINSADPAGDTYVPEFDFNGATRQGDVPDVGAYEFGGAGNPGWPVQEGFKEPGVSANAGGAGLGGCCSQSEDPEAAFLALPLIGLLGWRRRRSA